MYCFKSKNPSRPVLLLAKNAGRRNLKGEESIAEKGVSNYRESLSGKNLTSFTGTVSFGDSSINLEFKG